VDHTKLDVIVVDDIDRQPIGRPWITLAIDVFSRMVIGFYTSLDFPGNLSTGLCLAHAILPKDAWLRKRGCDGEWPCWGIMQSVHLDNAKEFRGNMLRRACQQYGIDILWRPVGKPNFGGHIERLLGTLLTVLHTLPGTTFSNPKQKGEYNSTRASSMTLTELEKWIATYLVDVYHRRIHFALNTTPLAKYNEGILGTPSKPGCGLPPVVSDPERLRLDFMPYVERTIQNYGVLINGIHYYHDVLRPWVNALEDGSPRRKRKFIFKCDPRDVSLISFYDPNLEEYRPIPYRDTSRPAVSLWELKQAQRRLKADGKKHVDEPAIFEALQRMHEITQQATKKTMSARRRDQRIRDHLNPARLQLVAMGFEPKSPQPPRPSTLQATVGPKDSDVIEPFDDLQLL
jgi:putative transposase